MRILRLVGGLRYPCRYPPCSTWLHASLDTVQCSRRPLYVSRRLFDFCFDALHCFAGDCAAFSASALRFSASALRFLASIQFLFRHSALLWFWNAGLRCSAIDLYGACVVKVNELFDKMPTRFCQMATPVKEGERLGVVFVISRCFRSRQCRVAAMPLVRWLR